MMIVFSTRQRLPYLLLLLLLVLSACAPTAYNYNIAYSPGAGIDSDAVKFPEHARVLVMPLDIQLFELSASGTEVLRADWTQTAKTLCLEALQARLLESEDTFSYYPTATEMLSPVPEERQLCKLHEVVGNTILLHKYLPGIALPTKKDVFDWGIGEGAQILHRNYTADYALFIQIRDSYATGGRKVLITGSIAASYFFPVFVSPGRLVGYVSLVDLKTGHIAWFNRLYSETADLREPEPARKSLDKLLKEFPL